jgi:hypothetical protein
MDISYINFDTMSLVRPAQPFSDLTDHFVIHMRTYGDLLYRWGLHHKRLEQSKPAGKEVARRYSTLWNNIGEAPSPFDSSSHLTSSL